MQTSPSVWYQKLPQERWTVEGAGDWDWQGAMRPNIPKASFSWYWGCAVKTFTLPTIKKWDVDFVFFSFILFVMNQLFVTIREELRKVLSQFPTFYLLNLKIYNSLWKLSPREPRTLTGPEESSPLVQKPLGARGYCPVSIPFNTFLFKESILFQSPLCSSDSIKNGRPGSKSLHLEHFAVEIQWLDVTRCARAILQASESRSLNIRNSADPG